MSEQPPGDRQETAEDPDARGLPSWLEGDEAGMHAATGRRWPALLLVLAALPWGVVLFLVVARPASPGGGLPADANAPMATEPAVVTSPAGVAPSGGPPSPLAGGDVGEFPAQAPMPPAAPDEPPGSVLGARFGAAAVPGPGHAAAVAALVVRDRLGGLGPRTGFGGGGSGGDTYVEHLVIEDVDLSIPPVAVVSVLAVVLQRPGQESSEAQVVRLAVPVLLDAADPRPAGEPWIVAGPRPDTVDLGWTPVDDPALAADVRTAVEDAGYTDVEVRSVDSSDAWPLRAGVRATAPGADEPGEHVVWLREYLGDLVVAGSRGAPAEPPHEEAGDAPEDGDGHGPYEPDVEGQGEGR